MARFRPSSGRSLSAMLAGPAMKVVEYETLEEALRAVDAFNIRERLVVWLRELGVTTLHTGHGPGAVISGQTMVVKTAGRDVDEAVVASPAMLAATFGDGVTGSARCDNPPDCDDNDDTLNLDDNDSDGFNSCTGDCDDTDGLVNPNATEVCDNGVDDDNDGHADCQDSECSEEPHCEGVEICDAGFEGVGRFHGRRRAVTPEVHRHDAPLGASPDHGPGDDVPVATGAVDAGEDEEPPSRSGPGRRHDVVVEERHALVWWRGRRVATVRPNPTARPWPCHPRRSAAYCAKNHHYRQ